MNILFVGIDVGKRHHVAAALSAAWLQRHHRLELCPILRFENSRAGFTILLTWLRAHGDQSHVVLERTGHYSAALLQFLSEAGVFLYLVQPYKRAVEKTDQRDARSLAQLLYSQRALNLPVTDSQLFARPYVVPGDVARLCGSLVRRREELTRDLVRCKNRLTAICDVLFPEFCQIFKDPNGPTALAVRQIFPTPKAVADADLEELCARRRRGRPARTDLIRLQELARDTIGTKDASQLEALSIEQTQLIAQLTLIETQIAHLEARVTSAIADSREGRIMQSMGIGPVQTAILLSGIGSIGNFPNVAALRGYLGWRPQHSQTGTTLDTVVLTRGGAPLLKRTMYLVTLSAIQREPWKTLYERLVPLKSRYDARLERYRGKMKVIGRIAGQFIRVMYTLLRRDYDLLATLTPGEPVPEPILYDASKHLAAIQAAVGRLEKRAEADHDLLPTSAQALSVQALANEG